MTIERRLKPQINVDLTPLIDIVFQLVIFFMISSTFKTAPGIELMLPDSGTATTITITEMSIVAVSEDEVYVNKIRTTAAGAKPSSGPNSKAEPQRTCRPCWKPEQRHPTSSS